MFSHPVEPSSHLMRLAAVGWGSKDELLQVERDYEQLVEDMNKETDSRVSELQNQLEVCVACYVTMYCPCV